MRILSSAEKCRRVARRIFFTTSVAGSFSGTDFCLIFAPSRATMSQKSSLPQPAESVSRVLTADTSDAQMSWQLYGPQPFEPRASPRSDPWLYVFDNREHEIDVPLAKLSTSRADNTKLIKEPSEENVHPKFRLRP